MFSEIVFSPALEPEEHTIRNKLSELVKHLDTAGIHAEKLKLRTGAPNDVNLEGKPLRVLDRAKGVLIVVAFDINGFRRQYSFTLKPVSTGPPEDELKEKLVSYYGPPVGAPSPRPITEEKTKPTYHETITIERDAQLPEIPLGTAAMFIENYGHDPEMRGTLRLGYENPRVTVRSIKPSPKKLPGKLLFDITAHSRGMRRYTCVFIPSRDWKNMSTAEKPQRNRAHPQRRPEDSPPRRRRFGSHQEYRPPARPQLPPEVVEPSSPTPPVVVWVPPILKLFDRPCSPLVPSVEPVIEENVDKPQELLLETVVIPEVFVFTPDRFPLLPAASELPEPPLLETVTPEVEKEPEVAIAIPPPLPPAPRESATKAEIAELLAPLMKKLAKLERQVAELKKIRTAPPTSPASPQKQPKPRAQKAKPRQKLLNDPFVRVLRKTLARLIKAGAREIEVVADKTKKKIRLV